MHRFHWGPEYSDSVSENKTLSANFLLPLDTLIYIIAYQRHLIYCKSIFKLSWLLLLATFYIWYESGYPSDVV